MATIYIMRGLPGSGKSTIAKQLSGTVVSADLFFINEDGEYVHDRSKIGAAHAWCQAQCRHLMLQGEDVIVDNTNVHRWEFQYYLNFAEEFGYNVSIIHVGTVLSIHELGERNTHGVPTDIIARMGDSFEYEWETCDPNNPYE